MKNLKQENDLLNAINANSERMKHYHYEAARRNRIQLRKHCQQKIAAASFEICLLGTADLVAILLLYNAYLAGAMSVVLAVLMGCAFGAVSGVLIAELVRRIKYYRRGC